MPIEVGDSSLIVRSKINQVLTNAGLDPADNVDTTSATALLNEAAGLWDVDVEFVDRMPEAEFRADFALLEAAIGDGFILDAYLASLSNGFRFNTRKLDRYFQESTGPTLADDVGETIGLALDQRLSGGKTLAEVLAAQPELITNGSFADGSTGWGVSANWTIAGGTATRSGLGTQGVIGQTTANIVAGRTYRVQWRRTDPSVIADTIRINVMTGAVPPTGANNFQVSGYFNGIGVQEVIFTATVSGYFCLWCFSSNTAISLTDVSVKEIPCQVAKQTGASTLRPVRQAEGAKFDASDDNLLMDYLATAGANFIFARTTVPATLPGTQVVAGASAASADRSILAVDTSGRACAGVGAHTTSTIVGTSDLRGTEADIALTLNGSTVRLIVNGVVEYEAAQSGGPTTAVPFRIGALNNNGTGSSYYGGAIKDISGGTDFIDLARFNQISAAVAANQ